MPRDDSAPRSWIYSERFACPEHGASLPELAPRTFSFNSPHGACPQCTGLGFTLEVDPELIVDPDRTLAEGAILPWTDRTTDYYDLLLGAIADQHGIDLDRPWRTLPERQRSLLLDGPRRRERLYLGARRKGGSWGWFEGVVPQLRRQHATSMSHAMRDAIEQFMSLRPCPACGGARLKPEALAVTVAGRNIHEICLLSVEDALELLLRARADRRRRPSSARGSSRRSRSACGSSTTSASATSTLARAAGHALGRRGPADPPGDPDRLGPGGRALHPRRAVDRPAPARQPQADRHPRAPARPGQHRAGGGARRGDDARPPTTSSTWAPAPATTAGGSWRRARWPTSRPSRRR